MSGTARAYTEKNRKLIKQRMKEVINGIAKTYNAEIILDYKDGYPPTINHSEPTKKVLEAANRIVGEKAGMPYLSCLLYTSPSPRDLSTSRMPSSA